MKQQFVFSILGLVKLATAQNLFESLVGSNAILHEETDANESLLLSQNVQKNNYGCLIEESVYANAKTEKMIKAPLVPIHMDYAQMEQFIKRSTEFHDNLSANGPSPVYTCSDREPLGDKTSAG